jgi:hypothetical protein
MDDWTDSMPDLTLGRTRTRDGAKQKHTDKTKTSKGRSTMAAQHAAMKHSGAVIVRQRSLVVGLLKAAEGVPGVCGSRM